MNVNEELKFLGKLKKMRGGGPGVGLGGQVGCERGNFLCKFKKKFFFWGGGVVGGGGVAGGSGLGGGQGGCERRMEVFVEN